VQCAGTLELGARVRFEAPVTACSLGIERGALLRIGDDCYFNDAVSITATERIVIGARALIGPGVRIMDTAFHGVSDRRRPPSRPVELGDDVWLASDCFIGPGVQIGRGAVVGAHSVVTKDVPAFAVMVGAPARQISSVDESKLLASLEEQLSLHGR
jgi:acetyltransferase-like isoleucine patch superfamily enzyme